MGLYIRKSVSVGPFRFNLSGSGVGISVGVPGFRIGASPRGNYVHMGMGGVYYRSTIPRRASKPISPRHVPNASPPTSDVVMHEIESADALTIVDSDSAALVAEMDAKRRKLRLWPWVLAAGIAAHLIVFSEWPSTPSWVGFLIAATFGVGILCAMIFDQIRKTTVLLYEFEPTAGVRFENLHSAFDALKKCRKKWHISAEGKVRDRKYHAGASSLIRRKQISIGLGSPPFVKTNVAVPYIPVGKQTLYFLPDVVLVVEPNAVGAVSYSKLAVESSQTRFIEEEGVPQDAKVVDRTWRYVNKKGGPDRRFKDNRELPVALYGEMTLSSDTGLREVVQVSRLGVAEILAAAAHEMVEGAQARY